MKRQATKPTAQKSQEQSQETNLEEQALESTQESSQATPQKADSSADSMDSSMDRHATASAVSRDDREGSKARDDDQNKDSSEQAQEATTRTQQDSSTTPSTAQDSSAAPSTQEGTPKESLDSKIAEGESGALQGEQGDKTSGLSKDFSSKTKSPYNLICVIISWHIYARVVIPRIRANEITTPYRIHFTKLDSRFGHFGWILDLFYESPREQSTCK